ncbi:MAG: hypothetical protein JWR53_1857 [Glaciihabitans sp.]|jgi:hypothetical protein|nr:hypothetical protein [Glaciihabitans sp.]MCU1535376.1 hypothetical protein [Glaciihabitans sp.]
MTDSERSIPPGWYEEPGSARTRWWDGEAWTDDVRDSDASPGRKRKAQLWIALGVVLFLALGIGFLFIGPGILW